MRAQFRLSKERFEDSGSVMTISSIFLKRPSAATLKSPRLPPSKRYRMGTEGVGYMSPKHSSRVWKSALYRRRSTVSVSCPGTCRHSVKVPFHARAFRNQWGQLRKRLRLPASIMCSKLMENRQVLLRTSSPHPTIRKQSLSAKKLITMRGIADKADHFSRRETVRP